MIARAKHALFDILAVSQKLHFAGTLEIDRTAVVRGDHDRFFVDHAKHPAQALVVSRVLLLICVFRSVFLFAARPRNSGTADTPRALPGTLPWRILPRRILTGWVLSRRILASTSGRILARILGQQASFRNKQEGETAESKQYTAHGNDDLTVPREGRLH
jgi:hypothetical protein